VINGELHFGYVIPLDGYKRLHNPVSVTTFLMRFTSEICPIAEQQFRYYTVTMDKKILVTFFINLAANNLSFKNSSECKRSILQH
jgi:hypothetical protein